MTDKELKQSETETVIMIKDNIEKMCQTYDLYEVYFRTEVVKMHIINLRKLIVAHKFRSHYYAGKTGECFIDETFLEDKEK